MVEKKELEKHRTLKILLKGATGTGKTYTACQIAKFLSEKGKKTFYIDNQKGASDELANFDEEVLSNIEYRNTFNFDDMHEIARTSAKEGAMLTVIDDLGLLQLLSRRSATERFIKQGYFYGAMSKGGDIGKVAIDNPALFHLTGFMYANPNRKEEDFLVDMIEQNHIIGAIMTDKVGEFKGREVDGWFGIIMKMKTKEEKDKDGVLRTNYYGELVKDRGAVFQKENEDVDIGTLILNPHKRLQRLLE